MKKYKTFNIFSFKKFNKEIDLNTARYLFNEKDEYWINVLKNNYNITEDDIQTFELGEEIILNDEKTGNGRVCSVITIDEYRRPEWLISTGGWHSILRDEVEKLDIPSGWEIPWFNRFKEFHKSLNLIKEKINLYDNIWLKDNGETTDISMLPYTVYEQLSLRRVVPDIKKFNVLYNTHSGELNCTISDIRKCDVRLFRKLIYEDE